MESTRRLWGAVLLQAYEDLEHEEFGGVLYAQAVAFFFSGGDWAMSRRDICDYLGLDPADLIRPALRIANARRLQAGLPPLQARPARPPATERRTPAQQGLKPAAAVPRPLPRLVAEFKPEPERKRRGGLPGKRWAYNPFDPFRPLPSEVRKAGSGAA
jgi:hypothetical protein